MSPSGDTGTEVGLVAWQVGRAPREPWRVAARCDYGYPSVIASPSLLADGTPFPTTFWLTCPWLTEIVSAEESAGAVAEWARLAAEVPELADALRYADDCLRAARRAESGGSDACASVGLAGQRDPLGVKCLHAHVALVLGGLKDPIGRELLGRTGTACPDKRCARYESGPDQEAR